MGYYGGGEELERNARELDKQFDYSEKIKLQGEFMEPKTKEELLKKKCLDAGYTVEDIFLAGLKKISDDIDFGSDVEKSVDKE